MGLQEMTQPGAIQLSLLSGHTLAALKAAFPSL